MLFSLKLYKYYFYYILQNILMFLARNFQKEIWGKKETWFEKKYELLQKKKYNEIDFNFGPSSLAEHCAKNDGYWNLFTAERFLNSIFPYEKNKNLKEFFRPFVYDEFQVRPYKKY